MQLERAPVWLLMIAIVMLNTTAQACLKIGATQRLLNPTTAMGVIAYGFSTLLYVLVLSRVTLLLAYPVVIGTTAIATCLIGAWMLHERVNSMQWVGIVCIVAGVVVMALNRGA